jgi:hypothetical protein
MATSTEGSVGVGGGALFGGCCVGFGSGGFGGDGGRAGDWSGGAGYGGDRVGRQNQKSKGKNQKSKITPGAVGKSCQRAPLNADPGATVSGRIFDF